MTHASLEEKLQRVGDAVKMLRDSPSNRFKFPYPDQHTTWQEEQEAWMKTAVLFDQSHHMTDVYFRGPDTVRLLSDLGTNSFTGFGRDRAKHYIACNEDGHMIGSAVLFGLEDDEVNVVGPTACANWLQYHVETGDYDVEVTRDERTADNAGPRLTFRLEIEGPHALAIVERANGGPIESPGFFRMTHFKLGGRPVRALVHTMVGLPGAESMGFEIWGPIEDSERCFEALLEAGRDLGIVRGGALAYYTGSIEAGYMAQPTPAIYTGENLRPYREWLSGSGYEAGLSVGGSFAPERVQDLYMTPFEFGYGHLVKFDHDFVGRDALEGLAEEPHRRKVWLRWSDEDVARVYESSLFGGENRAKFLETPLARYARVHHDAVMADDELAGISTMPGYTVNAASWMSPAMVDEEHARDGAELRLIWGEENGGTRKRSVERHVQTDVRVTVSTQSLVAAQAGSPS